MHLTDEQTPTRLIGIIEDIRMFKRRGDVWEVWVYTRTGPNGRDGHRFKVPHDNLPQWFVGMFEAEENKA